MGGARPPPLITFTLTSKVAVYAPAEWADTLTLFHLYQYMFSVVKSVLAGEGGGARPPPHITFTVTSKVAVYAPAEWADTLTLFHLYQYMYSVVYPISQLIHGYLVLRRRNRYSPPRCFLQWNKYGGWRNLECSVLSSLH